MKQKPEKVCTKGHIFCKTLWGVRESDNKEFRSSEIVSVNGNRVETLNTIYIVKELKELLNS